jgi:hypothetical protein
MSGSKTLQSKRDWARSITSKPDSVRAAQFLAWSYAESSGSIRVLWNVLAAPLVHLTGPLANEYFGVIVSLNSFLWAIALTLIIDNLAFKPKP